jgi:hypothetical protein
MNNQMMTTLIKTSMMTNADVALLYQLFQQEELKNMKRERLRLNQRRYASSKKGKESIVKRYVKRNEVKRNKYRETKKNRAQKKDKDDCDKSLHSYYRNVSDIFLKEHDDEQLNYEQFYKIEQQCHYELGSINIDQKQNVQFEQVN